MNHPESSLNKLTREIILENIITLQSLDVKEFFETQIDSKMNKNSTAILIQQEFVESVVNLSSFNQPKVVSKNSRTVISRYFLSITCLEIAMLKFLSV